MINSSTKVKEIYSKYIILNHDSHDEKLSIKYKIGTEIARLAKKSSKKIVAKKAVKSLSKIKRSNKLKLKKLTSSPKKMLSAVSIEPNYKNDNLYGFVIRSGKERALFKEIGLQSGGVILSINHIETQQLILNACSIKKRA